MRIVYLVILLAFPIVDLLATWGIAQWTGVPIWVWLGLPLAAGFLLLRNERLEFRARTIAALHGEHAALRDLFDSGRKVVAGLLLILPGLISDLFAVALLAFPMNLGSAGHATQAAGTSRHFGRGRPPIDGEFRRMP